MCNYCDPKSEDRVVFQDYLSGDWYLTVNTGEWDNVDEDWIYTRGYIGYCPFCGRKLSKKKEPFDPHKTIVGMRIDGGFYD